MILPKIILFPLYDSSYNSLMKHWRDFLSDEHGQDLIEYSLLIAFLSLATAALLLGQGASISAIWGINNSQLAAAATAGS